MLYATTRSAAASDIARRPEIKMLAFKSIKIARISLMLVYLGYIFIVYLYSRYGGIGGLEWNQFM